MPSGAGGVGSRRSIRAFDLRRPVSSAHCLSNSSRASGVIAPTCASWHLTHMRVCGRSQQYLPRSARYSRTLLSVPHARHVMPSGAGGLGPRRSIRAFDLRRPVSSAHCLSNSSRASGVIAPTCASWHFCTCACAHVSNSTCRYSHGTPARICPSRTLGTSCHPAPAASSRRRPTPPSKRPRIARRSGTPPQTSRYRLQRPARAVPSHRASRVDARSPVPTPPSAQSRVDRHRRRRRARREHRSRRARPRAA
jgi:hypothetical protein